MNHTRRTWAEIDLKAAENNIKLIRKTVGSCAVMSVVKADAYGHGAVEFAHAIDSESDFYAVSNIDEAIQLREGDISKPILILGYTPPQSMRLLCEYSITQTVFSYKYGKTLAEAAESAGKPIAVHIKLDTGMNRIGFSVQNSADAALSVEEITKLKQEKFLDFEGIFTHFAVADEPENPFTQTQFSRFMNTVETLGKRGIPFRYRHVSNSAAIMNFPEMRLDMVRPGLILYGLPTNPPDTRGLLPVMQLKTTVSFVHDLRKGDSVSYGMRFTADKDMKIATIPIGYADGLSRALSGRISFLINGRKAPLIGRICMDQCMVDVTGLDVETEDEVTVFGRELSVQELSDTIGTISYEIICDIGKRVPRVYIK